MNYEEISKKTMGYLYQSYGSLHESPLDPVVRVLVELRVSQINGCEYCCRVHTADAKKIGVLEEKINRLANGSSEKIFNEKERLALHLAETITCSVSQAKEEIKNLNKFFSEREISDLTICIALMNALNRIAISLRD